ncbi:MAG: TolC family protein, partial [Planctomycetota bacterium]
AAITQPLLRGAGRKIALENLTQAEQNTLYQIRSFNRFRKEFVTEIMTDYYRLLQLNDERINARDYYFALAEMQKKLKKRTVAGKLPRYELEQAEQDQMNAMSDYVRAQKDYDDALDAFKLRLAIIPSTPIQLDMNELAALRESVGADIALSPQQAVEIALDQRLDLANVNDGILDAERKVDVAADAIRAELNLIGIANPQNPSGRASVPSRSLSNGTDLEVTRDRYAAALQLDLPIDRLFEKNEYRRSLITLMQQQREYLQASDTVVLEVQTSHRRMTEAHQRYQIEQKSTRLAEKRTANTLLLLQYGRANTRDTLDAREDYLDAKNAETEALVDYAIATLEFFRDTEIMKIKPDGMWEKSVPLALE